MTGPQLVVEGMEVSYARASVVHKVDLLVRAGEIICLLGPNGAGKTSLLRGITSLARITDGRVMLGNTVISGKPPWQIARAGIAHVPQGRRCFGPLTVGDNLKTGLFGIEGRGGGEQRIEEILEAFPLLRRKYNARAEQLSGGQQQILAIARGLVSKPKFLLLDEPSLGLAPIVLSEVRDVIQNTLHAYGCGVLLVEQNLNFALASASRGYLLQEGRIVGEGGPSELRERALAAYLGGERPRDGG